LIASLSSSLALISALLAPPQDAAPAGAARPPLETVAERTSYQRTASHAEVMEFLVQLQDLGAPIEIATIGTTTAGKPLTLVIAGGPGVCTPPQAARSGKLVVYVQANIHAGEVEGKEASLALLRELTLGSERALLEHLVLLLVPDYNPDGNDKFGANRPAQGGPPEVGERANGQGLDLNRDCMKAESPEFQAVLAHVLIPWDPDVMMDLHTTNGSYHGYQLTYAPSLWPAPAPSPATYVRDHVLLELRKTMRDQHHFELFDYGDFDKQAEPKQWQTFDHLPRYCTNYIGLRNRMSVLSEAYAYADFKTRIDATYAFVLETLEYAVRNTSEIQRINRETDARVSAWGRDPAAAPPFPVRFEMASREGSEAVLWEETEPDADGKRRKRTGRIKPVTIPVFDRFVATRTVPYPAGFLLPAEMTPAIEVVQRHGIVVQRLTREWTGQVEVFTPQRVKVSDRPYQGHNPTLLDGDRALEKRTFEPGTFYVSSAQPLGLLACCLLDPESEDGILAWQIAGLTPEVGKPLPYQRVLAAPPRAAEAIESGRLR
jgi:hypothetical protein